MDETSFDRFLTGNQEFAETYAGADIPGQAAAGLLMITCMDSRIDPLAIVGLGVGDAKIIRSPGGRVTETGVNGCIAGVHLLGVNTIMVVQHTKCAMASGDDHAIAGRVQQACGLDADWVRFGADPDQHTTLAADVARLQHHPLITGRAAIGGFSYDVETGKIERWV